MNANAGAHAALIALLLWAGQASGASGAPGGVDVLIDRADWQDEAFRASGALVDDAAVLGYVRNVARRLVPPDAAPMHVEVLHDSDAFAFALPNGTVYISAGMLTRVRTESELASVIARESSLVAGPAGARMPAGSGRVDVGLATFGDQPTLPTLHSPSTARGMPKDIESAAADTAIQRLMAAGYDAAAAAPFHARLAAQAREVDSRRASVYADPKRLEEYARLLADAAHGVSGAAPANAPLPEVLREFVLRSCEHFVRFGRPELAIAALEASGGADAPDSDAARILAEAHRRRADPGFDATPRTTLESMPIDPVPNAPIVLPVDGFSARLPRDWGLLRRRMESVHATRAGATLSNITFEFRARWKTAAGRLMAELSPEDLAGYVLAMESSQRDPLDVTLEALDRAKIAGCVGFRAETSWISERIRYRRAVYGWAIAGGYYLLTYEAPERHFFAQDVAAFEATAASVSAERRRVWKKCATEAS